MSESSRDILGKCMWDVGWERLSLFFQVGVTGRKERKDYRWNTNISVIAYRQQQY